MAGKATERPFRRKVVWTASDGISKVVKTASRAKSWVLDTEARTFNLVRSPQKRLHLGLEVTPDGMLAIRNTAERKSYGIFDIASLPWDYDDNEKKYNLLAALLNNKPLVTIEVLSKPPKETVSSVRRDFEAKIANSRERGLSTPFWENNLRALAAYIEEKRTDHLFYGVYELDEMEAMSSVFESARADLVESANLTFGLLNGFWNETFWNKLLAKWEERRNQAHEEGVWTPEWEHHFIIEELTHYIIPGIIDRYDDPALPILKGESGSLACAAFEVPSLGVSRYQDDPDDKNSPMLKVPNTAVWLSDTLFNQVEEVGDTIVIAGTYFSTGRKLSERFQKRLEAGFFPPSLAKKEEAQKRAEKRAKERSEKEGHEVKPAQKLHLSDRDYAALWGTFLDDIFNAKDRLVRTHFTVLVQSPDANRAAQLADNVDNILTRKNVVFRRTTGQHDHLRALRSALPVILKDNYEEDVSPLSMDLTLAGLIPERQHLKVEGRLRIPIGTDKYGNLFELEFGDVIAVLSRPRAGKSTLFTIIIYRADGFLPRWTRDEKGNWIPGSIFTYWDASDIHPPADPEPKFGLELTAKKLNEYVDWSQFPDHLRYGIIYAMAEPYKSLARGAAAEKIKEDYLLLAQEAHARMILFRSHREVLKKNGLDYGFLGALDYWRGVLHSHEIPSMFVADEVIAAEEKALVAAMVDEWRKSGKSNVGGGIGGHAWDFIPDLPDKLRTRAKSLFPITIMGGTNLHRLLKEEAEIDETVFPDEATKLARTVAAITVSKAPGNFIYLEGGGGGRMDQFYAAEPDPNAHPLIKRKSEEAGRLYDV